MEEYEVESILKHKVVRKKNKVFYWYLIKWKGYASKHNTWEPFKNLNGAEQLRDDYHARLTAGLNGDERETSTLPNAVSKPLQPSNSPSLPRSRSPEAQKDILEDDRRKRPSEDDGDELRLNKKTKIGKLTFLEHWLTAAPKKRSIDDQNNNDGADHASKTLNEEPNAEVRRDEALSRWAKEVSAVDTAEIRVENDVDSEGPPSDFTYITDYRTQAGVVFSDDPLIGCDCRVCGDDGCCPSRNENDMAYTKFKRLKFNYIRWPQPIYECNKLCRCGPSCRNRVVQHGRKVPVCIFRTPDGKGWGVRAERDVKLGEFMMSYLGELITHEEAESRGKAYDADGMTYLFDLDLADEDLHSDFFTVDAKRYGNVAHFVNHSCDPNMKIYNVFVNNIDPKHPYLCLFACRDVKKGEELTFDYKMSGATEDESVLDQSELTFNEPASDSHYFAEAEDSVFEDASTTTTTSTPAPAPRERTENVSPRKNRDDEDRTPSGINPVTPKRRFGSAIVSSTPKGARSPFRAPALHKQTKCLCGSSKCRGYLIS